MKNPNPAFALLPVVGAAIVLCSTPVQAAGWCAERCDQVVIDWNATTHQVIKAHDGYADPMAASRVLAMVHLAMHDAVNAVQPRYASYALDTRRAATGRADDGIAAVAAVTAAHDVLLALYPKQQALLGAALDSTLHDAGHGAAVEQGRKHGADAAAATLARRAADGSEASEAYKPGVRAGEYQYTPGFEFLAAPHWRSVQPFSLKTAAQYRIVPPPALGSVAYAAAYDEVKATGGKAGARRSADEAQYAAYWYEFSDAGWNRVARTVARSQPQDVWQRARGFALLNAAMADAYIAGWDSKMHYNLWRPVTAIRRAAEDGNASTAPDTGWEPMLPTPPVQDYPSTHSALGAAAAATLAHAFGSDAQKFEMASPTAPAEAPTRRFESFTAAARENGDSRVKAGLHFRFAVTQGLQLGERIGRNAIATMLQPLQ